MVRFIVVHRVIFINQKLYSLNCFSGTRSLISTAVWPTLIKCLGQVSPELCVQVSHTREHGARTRETVRVAHSHWLTGHGSSRISKYKFLLTQDLLKSKGRLCYKGGRVGIAYHCVLLNRIALNHIVLNRTASQKGWIVSYCISSCFIGLSCIHAMEKVVLYCFFILIKQFCSIPFHYILENLSCSCSMF